MSSKHTNRFSLYSRVRDHQAITEESEHPTKSEVAEFLARMRQEDDLCLLTNRQRQDEKHEEYESSLALAYRRIKSLEEALHNEKLVSEALRRKLAIYETNLPALPEPLFQTGGLGGASRASASVNEWRVRLDEVQKSQLDRLTARR